MIAAVIFDLDGVIVSTDEFHYMAWKKIADEEGIPFGREENQRMRGVSRMESLEILLEKAAKEYSSDMKANFAQRKNGYYRALLRNISKDDILPGAMELVMNLKKRKIKTAIASSSRNTLFILERLGIRQCFDAVADGNEITKSKPDPEVFLLAARKLSTPPRECAAIEDALSGIRAAVSAGMKAVGIGFAECSGEAVLTARSLAFLTVDEILNH